MGKHRPDTAPHPQIFWSHGQFVREDRPNEPLTVSQPNEEEDVD